jgi:hypothetical protein
MSELDHSEANPALTINRPDPAASSLSQAPVQGTVTFGPAVACQPAQKVSG